jgi:phage baseplate assembly protein W
MVQDRSKIFKDLDLDFGAHPVTGDVRKKVGDEAIKRSVRNLVLTNFYERPFRSYIGSNAQKLLFEPINPLTSTFLKDAITEVIRNFEPRVSLLDVSVNVSEDQNGYVATLRFYINNVPVPIISTIFLERIR